MSYHSYWGSIGGLEFTPVRYQLPLFSWIYCSRIVAETFGDCAQ